MDCDHKFNPTGVVFKQKLARYLRGLYTVQTMILLVEDEAISRYAFAQILRFEGHEVMEAANGGEALTILDKRYFDVMITDLVMPGLDGFALVARIRQKWPNVRIVLISGYTAQYAAEALDESTEFLSKPVDSTDLIATVQRLLPAS
jgi:YesN/AraC family two-component response regulator